MGRYQALVNLSHPRKGDSGRETDLIVAGETVDLTDEEAAMYLAPRRDPEVIRPAKEAGTPMPRLLPRSLSGVAINPRTGARIGSPGPPQGARPDPAGSSAVQVLIPEAAEPQPDDESRPADEDAADIMPRSARRPAARG
jgi:hypothetical protein